MRYLLLCSLLFSALAAAEIYRWTDADGHVHFAESPQAGAVPVNVQAPPLQNDSAATERQQRTERFFDARREEQQQAATKAREQQVKSAQECQRLREQFAQLDQGGSFYSTDAQGQRVYYSDKQMDNARSQLKARLAQRCQ